MWRSQEHVGFVEMFLSSNVLITFRCNRYERYVAGNIFRLTYYFLRLHQIQPAETKQFSNLVRRDVYAKKSCQNSRNQTNLAGRRHVIGKENYGEKKKRAFVSNVGSKYMAKFDFRNNK